MADTDTKSIDMADADAAEAISFALIAAAGQARSAAFEALTAAKEGDFARADELMAESEKAAIDAHEQQTKLLVQEAQGNHVAVSVILVHAQDHLMTSMLAQELIKEIVELRREVAQLKA